MHKSVMDWVEAITIRDDLLTRAKILEIGSYNVNGSVREIFCKNASGETIPMDNYTGIDVVPGPGVDLVIPADGPNARKLPFVAAQFDLVLSTEALEHDAKFWETLAEIGRVMKLGARVLLTARGMRLAGNGFAYHGDAHFKDIYRFLPDAVPTLCALMRCKLIEWVEDPQKPGLFIYAERSES